MKNLHHWLAPVPLIAILRGVRPEEVIGIAEVLLAAGVKVIEVPLNSPQPLESIKRLSASFASTALIGAGTVTSAQLAADVCAAGGKLIVMPHADARVVTAAKHLGMLTIPGFATPTEAFAMLEAGADGLKLFPAEAYPPAVLRALRAVLPKQVPILPVGSITPANLAPYLHAGANGFGLGSALYRAGDDAASVAAKAREFVGAWISASQALR